MVLKGVLIVCVALLLCECDAYLLPSPFYPGQRGSPFQMRYYHGPLFAQRFDPSVSEASSEVPEKEYGTESKESNTKYFVSTEKLSWYEARDTCKSKGMVLAHPDTYAKQNDLVNYIREHDLVPKDVYSGYWLGSRRSTDDDPWIWESNGQEIGRFGWLPGEPNGYEGENCMELKQSYGMGWNNYYCHELKRFICEKLPHTSESDKNTMVDTKDALHREILKGSFDGKKDNNKALDVLFKTHLQEFARNKEFPSISEDLPSTTTITERERPNVPEFNPEALTSEILPSTTTTTERERPNVPVFNPEALTSEILPSTTTTTERGRPNIPEFNPEALISEILPSTTTTTEREVFPDIPGFNPDAIIFRDLDDDYYQYDSDYIESMEENPSQRLQAFGFI